MSRTLNPHYRQPLFGAPDPRLRKSLAASTSLGLILLVIVFLAPVRAPVAPSVDEVPERLAKLILKPKLVVPPPVAPAARIQTPSLPEPLVEVEPAAPPEKAVEKTPDPPQPRPRKARKEEKLSPDRGQAGRTKARQEVTKTLAGTTQSLQSTLSGLTTDLAAARSKSGDEAPKSRRRGARPGAGRSGKAVEGAVAARTDIGEGVSTGTALNVDLIDIEAVTGTGSSSDLASADPAVAVSGSYRSNASLLAVVRKYAAGIQFCYDNQLKQEPDLRGKMVVVLTVLPSGQVSEAKIADDSLGSGALRQCVLAQVREWRFPAVPDGVVTFRTPFVFSRNSATEG